MGELSVKITGPSLPLDIWNTVQGFFYGIQKACRGEILCHRELRTFRKISLNVV